MNGRPWARGPLWLTFRRCLAGAALPTLAAALVSTLLALWLVPTLPGLAPAPGARTPWLHLPLLVAAAACAVHALAFWPLCALRRTGADQVRRLQRGPLGGCGAAAAGALLAQVVLTLPLTLGVARLFGAPATAAVRFAPALPPQPLLDHTRPRLTIALEGDRVRELQLRPLAAPPTGAYAPTRLRVLADGAPVAGGEVEFGATRELRRVPLPPLPLASLTLEYVDGTVPLLFARDTVLVVGAAERSGLANGTLTAVIGLLPGFTALALAILCGAAAGLATVRTVALVLLFVQAVGDVGPWGDAVLALLRGHWVLPPDGFWRWFPSLAGGSVAMIGAMLLRRGTAR